MKVLFLYFKMNATLIYKIHKHYFISILVILVSFLEKRDDLQLWGSVLSKRRRN